MGASVLSVVSGRVGKDQCREICEATASCVATMYHHGTYGATSRVGYKHDLTRFVDGSTGEVKETTCNEQCHRQEDILLVTCCMDNVNCKYFRESLGCARRNYTGAKALCEANGMRLCSTLELRQLNNLCDRSRHCDLLPPYSGLYKRTWTSDVCSITEATRTCTLFSSVPSGADFIRDESVSSAICQARSQDELSFIHEFNAHGVAPGAAVFSASRIQLFDKFTVGASWTLMATVTSTSDKPLRFALAEAVSNPTGSASWIRGPLVSARAVWHLCSTRRGTFAENKAHCEAHLDTCRVIVSISLSTQEYKLCRSLNDLLAYSATHLIVETFVYDDGSSSGRKSAKDSALSTIFKIDVPPNIVGYTFAATATVTSRDLELVSLNNDYVFHDVVFSNIYFAPGSGVSACADSTPTLTFDPADTCTWLYKLSAHSSQPTCADGTMCSGATCCASRGGVALCPADQPVMCQDGTCDTALGRCIGVQGGPRVCGGENRSASPCFQTDVAWLPAMSDQVASIESSAARCQLRCTNTGGCHRFMWRVSGQSCELAGSDAKFVAFEGVVSGPRTCNARLATSVSVETSLPGKYVAMYTCTDALGQTNTAVRDVSIACEGPNPEGNFGGNNVKCDKWLQNVTNVERIEFCKQKCINLNDCEAYIMDNVPGMCQLQASCSGKYFYDDDRFRQVGYCRRTDRPPILTLTGASKIARINEPWNEGVYECVDMEDPVDPVVVRTTDLDINAPGTYNATYCCTDLAKQTACSSQTVTVVGACEMFRYGNANQFVQICEEQQPKYRLNDKCTPACSKASETPVPNSPLTCMQDGDTSSAKWNARFECMDDGCISPSISNVKPDAYGSPLSCREGQKVDNTCTPNCQEGYVASEPFLTCKLKTTLEPANYTCQKQAYKPSPIVSTEIGVLDTRIAWSTDLLGSTDCAFSYWHLQMRLLEVPDDITTVWPPGSPVPTVPATLPDAWKNISACLPASMNVRSAAHCHVTDLFEGSKYAFRLKEGCANSALDSPWSEPTNITMKYVKRPSVIFKVPNEDEQMLLEPNEVIIAFDTFIVKQDKAAANFVASRYCPWVPPVTSTINFSNVDINVRPNVIGAARVQLISGKILMLVFPDDVAFADPGCNINVTLNAGYAGTVQAPMKPTPPLSWVFVFVDQHPSWETIQVLRRTISVVTILIKFTYASRFTCVANFTGNGKGCGRADAPPDRCTPRFSDGGLGKYEVKDWTGFGQLQGIDDATVTLNISGLFPGTEYFVNCSGHKVWRGDDRFWIPISEQPTALRVAATFSTEEDNETRYASFQVAVFVDCDGDLGSTADKWFQEVISVPVGELKFGLTLRLTLFREKCLTPPGRSLTNGSKAHVVVEANATAVSSDSKVIFNTTRRLSARNSLPLRKPRFTSTFSTTQWPVHRRRFQSRRSVPGMLSRSRKRNRTSRSLSSVSVHPSGPDSIVKHFEYVKVDGHYTTVTKDIGFDICALAHYNYPESYPCEEYRLQVQVVDMDFTVNSIFVETGFLGRRLTSAGKSVVNVRYNSVANLLLTAVVPDSFNFSEISLHLGLPSDGFLLPMTLNPMASANMSSIRFRFIGQGSGLLLCIQYMGGVYRTNYIINFEPPTILRVSPSNQYSIYSPTDITVTLGDDIPSLADYSNLKGTKLEGGFKSPGSFLRVEIVKDGYDSNICLNSRFVHEWENVTCTLQPSGLGPLIVRIVARDYMTNSWHVTQAMLLPGAVSYKPPVILDLIPDPTIDPAENSRGYDTKIDMGKLNSLSKAVFGIQGRQLPNPRLANMIDANLPGYALRMVREDGTDMDLCASVVYVTQYYLSCTLPQCLAIVGLKSPPVVRLYYGDLVSADRAELFTIPRPVVLSFGPASTYDVGQGRQMWFSGSNFGDWQCSPGLSASVQLIDLPAIIHVGERGAQCVPTFQNNTYILCTIKGPILHQWSLPVISQHRRRTGVPLPIAALSQQIRFSSGSNRPMINGDDSVPAEAKAGAPDSLNLIVSLKTCPAGHRRLHLDDEQCVPCAPGRMSSALTDLAPLECVECASGKYQDAAGATACKSCPENTVTLGLADSVQSCVCMEGYFSPVYNTTKRSDGTLEVTNSTPGIPCVPCHDAAFLEEEAKFVAESELRCGRDIRLSTICDGSDVTSCVQAMPFSVCKVLCLGGTALPVARPGFWVTGHTPMGGGNVGLKPSVVLCNPPSSCRSRNMCRLESDGDRCRDCKPGYYHDTKTGFKVCEPCGFMQEIGLFIMTAFAVFASYGVLTGVALFFRMQADSQFKYAIVVAFKENVIGPLRRNSTVSKATTLREPRRIVVLRKKDVAINYCYQKNGSLGLGFRIDEWNVIHITGIRRHSPLIGKLGEGWKLHTVNGERIWAFSGEEVEQQLKRFKMPLRLNLSIPQGISSELKKAKPPDEESDDGEEEMDMANDKKMGIVLISCMGLLAKAATMDMDMPDFALNLIQISFIFSLDMNLFSPQCAAAPLAPLRVWQGMCSVPYVVLLPFVVSHMVARAITLTGLPPYTLRVRRLRLKNATARVMCVLFILLMPSHLAQIVIPLYPCKRESDGKLVVNSPSLDTIECTWDNRDYVELYACAWAFTALVVAFHAILFASVYKSYWWQYTAGDKDRIPFYCAMVEASCKGQRGFHNDVRVRVEQNVLSTQEFDPELEKVNIRANATRALDHLGYRARSVQEEVRRRRKERCPSDALYKNLREQITYGTHHPDHPLNQKTTTKDAVEHKRATMRFQKRHRPAREPEGSVLTYGWIFFVNQFMRSIVTDAIMQMFSSSLPAIGMFITMIIYGTNIVLLLKLRPYVLRRVVNVEVLLIFCIFMLVYFATLLKLLKNSENQDKQAGMIVNITWTVNIVMLTIAVIFVITPFWVLSIFLWKALKFMKAESQLMNEIAWKMQLAREAKENFTGTSESLWGDPTRNALDPLEDPRKFHKVMTEDFPRINSAILRLWRDGNDSDVGFQHHITALIRLIKTNSSRILRKGCLAEQAEHVQQELEKLRKIRDAQVASVGLVRNKIEKLLRDAEEELRDAAEAISRFKEAVEQDDLDADSIEQLMKESIEVHRAEAFFVKLGRISEKEKLAREQKQTCADLSSSLSAYREEFVESAVEAMIRVSGEKSDYEVLAARMRDLLVQEKVRVLHDGHTMNRKRRNSAARLSHVAAPRIMLSLRDENGLITTISLRKHSPWSKVKELYCALRCIKDTSAVKFKLAGRRIPSSATPHSLHLEDADVIDVEVTRGKADLENDERTIVLEILPCPFGDSVKLKMKRSSALEKLKKRFLKPTDGHEQPDCHMLWVKGVYIHDETLSCNDYHILDGDVIELWDSASRFSVTVQDAYGHSDEVLLRPDTHLEILKTSYLESRSSLADGSGDHADIDISTLVVKSSKGKCIADGDTAMQHGLRDGSLVQIRSSFEDAPDLVDETSEDFSSETDDRAFYDARAQKFQESLGRMRGPKAMDKTLSTAY
eukprot:TRINITY_DN28567_c0_g2_i4.p1 TRINITY_DN28567_c0_g2~~TRINITY_DN28567_c0_g2_i4.p1  ORF type:complete len:3494 (-),score=332.40 TRINITY_DN28567_c0_g2_i4:673-11079(-)